MSALVLVTESRITLRSPLPAVVTHKIATFLAAGHTGQIVLDVKEGNVLAYKLTEAGRVSAADVDRFGIVAQDSER